MEAHIDVTQATKQDWIDLIGIYRVIVRARTGHRFKGLEWAH